MKTKIISILIVIVILNSVLNVSYSTTINKRNQTDNYEQLIESALAGYCSIYYDNNTVLQLTYSQPISPIGAIDDNIQYVFVFSDNDCVGLLIISYIHEQLVSSFIHQSIPAISRVYNNKLPFSLVISDNTLFCISGDYYDTVIGTDNNLKRESLLDYQSKNIIQLNHFQNRELPEEDEVATRSSSTLFVPIVNNSFSPDTGWGLCWSASLASIIMYKTGYTGITALSLYEQLKNNYTPRFIYGYPCGIPSWEQRALTLYNIGHNYYNNGLTFEFVRLFIDSDRPIFADLEGYCNSDMSDEEHAVVINGYINSSL